MFYFVNTADEAVGSDLEEWSRVAASNVNQAIENDSPLRGRIEANARMISLIQEGALLQAEDFRGVRARDGNLQAGAIVTDMGEYLYVDFIATAPWNMKEDSPKSVRRAATMLMAQIVRESIDKGYEGQIVVDAVASSADFYRRMGFIETGESSAFAPEMVLTPEAALLFSRRLDRRVVMPLPPEKREKYLQELEELERSSGGVFACITPSRHKKRWEQKVLKLEQEIAAAATAEEKERLQQKLIELNQREQSQAFRIALVHSLLAQGA